MFRLKLLLFFLLFFIKIHFSKQDVNDDLRYSVILSEPLDSTLDWDYDVEDDTKLIFSWKITLTDGYSGILAFSKYDLETNDLDVIIFGEDERLYNRYTNKNSLFLRDNHVELNYKVENIENIKNNQKKYTIKIIRPLDTCDKEKRNYIIDRSTTHLLTGTMTYDDFQGVKRGKPIYMDVKRMSLTLQRVQLLKSQVNSEIILFSDS